MTEINSDEFAWLPAQAASVGARAVVPGAMRVSARTADGLVSGLRFGLTPPTVVFLHGAGLNAHTFDTTVIALGEPALCLDLPGHGDSDWRSDDDYSPATIGPAVAAAIAELTDTPIVLVGHSLGGLTAAWVAAHHPDLVTSLILLDITPGIDPSVGPQILRAFYEQLEFTDRAAVSDWAEKFGMGGDRASLERGVFHNTRVRPDGIVEWKHHFARLAATILPTADGERPGVTGYTGWSDLDAVTAPIALVRGTDGFVSPEAAADFTTRLPAASVTELVGGHNLQETDPTGLAALIRTHGAL